MCSKILAFIALYLLGTIAPTAAYADQIRVNDVGNDIEFVISIDGFPGTSASFYSNDDDVAFEGNPDIFSFEDLSLDNAHLFFLNGEDGLAIGLIYFSNDAITADAVLDGSSMFNATPDPYLFRDGVGADTYSVVDGNLVTSHIIGNPATTDGYVADLDGVFLQDGDTLTLSISSSGLNNLLVWDSGSNSFRIVDSFDAGLCIATFTRVSETPLLGDINRDCVINLLDVLPFVDLLASSEFHAEADINQDGVVNLLDVAPFIQLLSGG